MKIRYRILAKDAKSYFEGSFGVIQKLFFLMKNDQNFLLDIFSKLNTQKHNPL
jgi:hypothetical protein